MTARAGGRRNNRHDDRAEERALLELLSHGLSEEEIQRVLACALLVLDERGRERLFARLGAETSATLRRLLASRARSRTKAPPSAGSAKIREEWDKAWSEWEACVAESGDEDGRYVVREHHWEEPYLDGSSLAQDLEPLAAGYVAYLTRTFGVRGPESLSDAQLRKEIEFLLRRTQHADQAERFRTQCERLAQPAA